MTMKQLFQGNLLKEQMNELEKEIKSLRGCIDTKENIEIEICPPNRAARVKLKNSNIKKTILRFVLKEYVKELYKLSDELGEL